MITIAYCHNKTSRLLTVARKVSKLSIIVTLTALYSCEVSNEASSISSNTPENVRYKAKLVLNDSIDLPFIIEYTSGSSLVLHNSTEKIEMIPESNADSINFQFPVFNSALKFIEHDNGELRGVFHDYDKGPEFSLRFIAVPSNEPRFTANTAPCCSLNYPWEVIMRYDSDKPRHALGEFFQNESSVTGSIITQSGDYRYLEGVLDGEQMSLATFDGKFAYVFRARLQNNEFFGHYFAGNSEAIPWKATRNDDFRLPSSSSLTFIKSEYDKFSFNFPDKNGNLRGVVEGKVNLVQILGSWCPNCMDEARVLEKWFQRYQDKGLVVTGLAFEYTADEEKGWQAIEKMKRDLQLSYPILFAGQATPQATQEALPMLNKVMAYPTLIVIDRKGNVRQIKTGFKGPGTSYFTAYKKDMESLINELLHE
jgi:thiol-disulfide isomerase/thioredoxin